MKHTGVNTHAHAHTQTNNAHSLLRGNCLPGKKVEIFSVVEYSTSTKVVFVSLGFFFFFLLLFSH